MNIIFQSPRVVNFEYKELKNLASNEILCVSKKSLISTGTEISCLRGEFDNDTIWSEWVNYPFYPGYSMTAEVIEVGAEVRGINIGDRIVCQMSHRKSFVIDANKVIKIPFGIDDEEACWVDLAVTAQLGVRRAEHKLGDTVVVIGLGILGQLVLQYLILSGARQVIVVGDSDLRTTSAVLNGATSIVKSRVENAFSEIRAITDNNLADVVYDITGNPEVLSTATKLVKRQGKVILLGDTTQPSKQLLGTRVVSNSASIVGVHATLADYFHDWSYRDMVGLFFEYVTQKRMNVKSLITHRVNPLEAPKIYNWLLCDRASSIGVIFDWTLL